MEITRLENSEWFSTGNKAPNEGLGEGLKARLRIQSEASLSTLILKDNLNSALLNPSISSILVYSCSEVRFLSERQSSTSDSSSNHCNGNSGAIRRQDHAGGISNKKMIFLTKQSVVPDIGSEPAPRKLPVSIALYELVRKQIQWATFGKFILNTNAVLLLLLWEHPGVSTGAKTKVQFYSALKSCDRGTILLFFEAWFIPITAAQWIIMPTCSDNNSGCKFASVSRPTFSPSAIQP